MSHVPIATLLSVLELYGVMDQIPVELEGRDERALVDRNTAKISIFPEHLSFREATSILDDDEHVVDA